MALALFASTACGAALGSRGLAEQAKEELSPKEELPDASPSRPPERGARGTTTVPVIPDYSKVDTKVRPGETPQQALERIAGEREAAEELAANGVGLPAMPTTTLQLPNPALLVPSTVPPVVPPAILDSPLCLAVNEFVVFSRVATLAAPTAAGAELTEIVRTFGELLHILEQVAPPDLAGRLGGLLAVLDPTIATFDGSRPGALTALVNQFAPSLTSIVYPTITGCYASDPSNRWGPSLTPDPGLTTDFLGGR